MQGERIKGLDYDVCQRCDERTTSPHRVHDAQGKYTGCMGCRVEPVRSAQAKND